MENSRENTIVIFAGYTNEMERFLQRNPGLRSRIAFHIPFDDYTTPELCSITNLIAEKNGMKIADEATPRLEKIFDIARQRSDFGNGRYARNLKHKRQICINRRELESCGFLCALLIGGESPLWLGSRNCKLRASASIVKLSVK